MYTVCSGLSDQQTVKNNMVRVLLRQTGKIITKSSVITYRLSIKMLGHIRLSFQLYCAQRVQIEIFGVLRENNTVSQLTVISLLWVEMYNTLYYTPPLRSNSSVQYIHGFRCPLTGSFDTAIITPTNYCIYPKY